MFQENLRARFYGLILKIEFSGKCPHWKANKKFSLMLIKRQCETCRFIPCREEKCPYLERWKVRIQDIEDELNQK